MKLEKIKEIVCSKINEKQDKESLIKCLSDSMCFVWHNCEGDTYE